jgi:hypothetical protein
MKLYRISQSVNNYRYTYDAAIVAAPSEEAAKLIHPSKESRDYLDWMSEEERFAYSWAPVKDIIVEYIGEAGVDIKEGVVLASFRAG